MSPGKRVIFCIGLLSAGVAAQAALDVATECERPELKGKLATIPMTLGRWVGGDQPVDPKIVEKAQTDDWINRVYEDTAHPGLKFSLWINYSNQGLNMRHSPEVCLPSGGWTRVESATKVIALPRPGRPPLKLTRLGYSQGELFQGIGFWYYIFGEGEIEHWVRNLPITSRSSHGRTTRGAGLTVEVFTPGEIDPDGDALTDFATSLLQSLEPLLPDPRAEYHVP